MRAWGLWPILVAVSASLCPGQELALPPPENTANAWSVPRAEPTASLPPVGLPERYASEGRLAPVVSPVAPERYLESTWYGRVDYFHWNERLNGMDFVNESGPLYTLGYSRRVGRERFRAELFGGDVDYDGSAQYDDGTSEPLSSTTGYLGVRGEYDLLFEPDWMPQGTFFIGVGSRLWFRDLKDDVTASGNPVTGYQETWWTFYPYLGLETRRVPTDRLTWFASGRIGLTPLTYQHVTWFDVTLHPKTGITGQVEAGLQARWLHISAFFDAMTWGESAVVRDCLQPQSSMFTVGLKAGISF